MPFPVEQITSAFRIAVAVWAVLMLLEVEKQPQNLRARGVEIPRPGVGLSPRESRESDAGHPTDPTGRGGAAVARWIVRRAAVARRIVRRAAAARRIVRRSAAARRIVRGAAVARRIVHGEPRLRGGSPAERRSKTGFLAVVIITITFKPRGNALGHIMTMTLAMTKALIVETPLAWGLMLFLREMDRRSRSTFNWVLPFTIGVACFFLVRARARRSDPSRA